jgi:hypothetical protein
MNQNLRTKIATRNAGTKTGAHQGASNGAARYTITSQAEAVNRYSALPEIKTGRLVKTPRSPMTKHPIAKIASKSVTIKYHHQYLISIWFTPCQAFCHRFNPTLFVTIRINREKLTSNPIQASDSRVKFRGYRGSKGTHRMWMMDIAMNPAIIRPALSANDSTKYEAIMATMNGTIANMAAV